MKKSSFLSRRVAPELKISTNNPNFWHWNLENGYDSSIAAENEYPIRVFSAKSIHLIVGLQVFSQDIGLECEAEGFQIGMTVPGDSVKILDTVYMEMMQFIDVNIKPKMIITSNKLRGYSSNQRQCFFDYERKLRFFQIYTQHNCERECLANFTKSRCGCVKYSMPSKWNFSLWSNKSINQFLLKSFNLFETVIFIKMLFHQKKNFFHLIFQLELKMLPFLSLISFIQEIIVRKFVA